MRSVLRLFLMVCGCLAIAACQMKPTKTGQTQRREFDIVVNKATKTIDLNNEELVILDTRSSFDYGLNRVQNSLHFPWQNLSEKPETGELLRDLRSAALKLSLAGMTPKTPVLIVGYGDTGEGEEGRLAWTLLYLGFHDVQTATVDMFRKNWTQAASAPAKNAVVWTPNPRADMIMPIDEFRTIVANGKMRVDSRIWIVDVRSTNEYFGKDTRKLGQPTPDIQAINIEWREFFTPNGRPNWQIRKKLNNLGVKNEDRVVLISNRGVRSGAAAYALAALGFTNAQNVLGGWKAYLAK